MIIQYELYRGKPFVLTGATALSRYGYCAANPNAAEVVERSDVREVVLACGTFWVKTGVQPRLPHKEVGGFWVAHEFDALCDLMVTYLDDTAIQQTLEDFDYEDKLPEFYVYAKERVALDLLHWYMSEFIHKEGYVVSESFEFGDGFIPYRELIPKIEFPTNSWF